ncbi:hypothetical protein AWB69_08852 [Caballeronia udeis]|uniref:Uncharacterized protein n=1 Tax=Caballeronia udeis TaxID=1232866 RepID=A0A158JV36_9BURK|nr:hypothetical protein AWB69_08852 [Caballeronia udeis]
MAACVVIGERAGKILKTAHSLQRGIRINIADLYTTHWKERQVGKLTHPFPFSAHFQA